RRAVGAPVALPSVSGHLLGAVTYADGTFALLGHDDLPWSPQNRGTFSTLFDLSGSLATPRFHTATDRDPRLTGRPVALGGAIYMTEVMFVPSEGTDLLFARAFGP
ncbi:MAG: hypothetical protein WA208_06100, partial [Thermoanaerobaculia bacterium]